MAHGAQDASSTFAKINIGGYLMGRDRGEPLTAIPVFLHRRFRHGFVFVNRDAGIRAPKDLIGKKIGGTNFQPASNIWMRGILEEHYGVPHRQCIWVVERSEDVEFTPAQGPAHRDDRRRESGSTSCWRRAKSRPCCRPIFRGCFSKATSASCGCLPNYKDIEIEYFKKTGIFPIMHVTVVQQEIIDKYPWVATNLVKAFDEAKALAYRRIANPRVVPLAWIRTAWEEQQEVLGTDPWAYGLNDANRKNLQTVQLYCQQQGLIGRMLPLDELFADTDLGDAGGGAENI